MDFAFNLPSGVAFNKGRSVERGVVAAMDCMLVVITVCVGGGDGLCGWW